MKEAWAELYKGFIPEFSYLLYSLSLSPPCLFKGLAPQELMIPGFLWIGV